jgi:hypothetical protein
LFQVKSFFAGVAGSEDCGYEDDGGTGFDEEFAAVEPVDGGASWVGVGEDGVPEEGGGGEVDGEVEGFPGAAVTWAPIWKREHRLTRFLAGAKAAVQEAG